MVRNLRLLIALYTAITGIVFLTACHSGVSGVKKNDTARVLQILLDSVFYTHRLTAAAQLGTIDPLKDTLIFERDNILKRHLPKGLRYTLLSKDEMCELMSIHNKAGLRFLKLDEFVKTPNGYRMALGIHCMSRGIVKTYQDENGHFVCEREKYCNAVLYMDVIKKGDDFYGSKFHIGTY